MVRRNFVLSTNTLFWQGPLHTHTFFVAICLRNEREVKSDKVLFKAFLTCFEYHLIGGIA